jgi:hypothetical protein
MSDLRDLLERADRAVARVPLPPDGIASLQRRRDRRVRNQRIAAGVVGFAVFVAGVWIVATGGSSDRSQTPAVIGPTLPPAGQRGVIGPPPEGATPSTPERGELVLHFYGGTTSGPRTEMWAYADGRLIWRQESVNLPYGANRLFTGYLEQRLTREGLELLRSEVISTGMFEESVSLKMAAIGPCLNVIEVRDGDRLVRVSYSRDCLGQGHPEATREQAGTLLRLDGRLAGPASWLPASAWDEREIRAYVPSRYEVCIESQTTRSIGPSRIATLLPAPERSVFGAIGWTRDEQSAPDRYCSQPTLDEARALAETLDAAALDLDVLERDFPESYYRLTYTLWTRDFVGGRAQIWFEPILPHGEWPCSPCG